MSTKIKILKLIYMIFIIFILINTIIAPSTFAFGNFTGPRTKFGATALKLAVAGSEVGVSGYFIIKLTLTGIQYFTASAVSEKVDNRNKMKWTLLYGVLALLGLFLFSYAVGLR